jgi:pimeloyl-ACP methyl ester carboxylesterase
VKTVSLSKTNDLSPSINSSLSRFVNFQSVYINSGLEQELFNADFLPKLKILTLPVLCLFGKYDFVVPPTLADDVLSKIQSKSKKKVVFNFSGHDTYLTESPKFNAEIISVSCDMGKPMRLKKSCNVWWIISMYVLLVLLKD